MSETPVHLIDEVRELIVTSLSLEGVSPGEIDPNAPLFGDGLGLDSIDALELGIAIQKRFGVIMDAGDEQVRANFANVTKLAAFIHRSRN